MKNIARFWMMTILVCTVFAVANGPGVALAQAGSGGGSIGNDEKSVSGSRSAEPERPARRSGGGGNFDGAWVVNSVGASCGSSTSAIVVTSGKIIGEGLIGTVSSNGAARSVGNYGSITVISSGRFSGRSGSGTFRRSDGCVGTWAVSKQ